MESVVSQPVFVVAIQGLDILQRLYMRLVGYINPVKNCRTVFGATMRCDSRDFVQRRIRFFQIFEHNLTYFTLQRLREGDVYVDIGANVGYFSLLASRCVGNTGKVISVEADPLTFAKLVRNLDLNDCRNVTPCNIAAVAVACRVGIIRSDSHNCGSSVITVGAGKGDVEGLPLRDILGDDLGRASFIKIDIEGSEAPILSAILEAMDELPHNLTVAAEIGSASAEILARFVASGFSVYAVPNIYTIDYYLVRSYLSQCGEEGMVRRLPVSCYDPTYRDYIIERR